MSVALSFFLIALAVSLDSFSTGLTYGIRKIRIPIRSIVIIALCSGLTLLIAMMFGQLIEWFLSPTIVETIGGIILLSLGAWAIFQVMKPPSRQKEKLIDPEKNMIVWELKSFGLVIQVFRKPLKADMDGSGTITGIEAVLLGLALSLDAFGAGIGAAMLNFSPFILSFLVMIMSASFLNAGMLMGKKASRFSGVRLLSYIPGIVLILIGVSKL